MKTHATRAFTKLGVRDRVQIVVAAYESGLAQPGSTTYRPILPVAPMMRVVEGKVYLNARPLPGDHEAVGTELSL